MSDRPDTGPRKGTAFKVVVAGPFAAGKTTLIRTISEIAVVSTERDISDHTREVKAATTVALDFGRLTVGKDLSLHLFGTPGQERFEFMWEILAEGMLGFILLLDHERDGSIEECRHILRVLSEAADVPYVVAVNKVRPQGDRAALAVRTRERLQLPSHVRVVTCDARNRGSVRDVLLELLYAVRETVVPEVKEAGA